MPKNNKTTFKKIVKGQLNRQNSFLEIAIADAVTFHRAEIGRELHDNICQLLTAARLSIHMARSKHEQRLEFLELSDRNISTSITAIRCLSHGLMLPALPENSLTESIHRLTDDISQLNPFQIKTNFSNFNESTIDNKLKLNIYRIIQEQLNNIIQHAHAKQVMIKLSAGKNYLQVLIHDNGIGSGTIHRKKNAGIGLDNIRNRTLLFAGSLHIKTSPNNGFRLRLRFPIAPASDTAKT